MGSHDNFSEQYQGHLDGTYDCVDRIVLNAYFIPAQSNGGFRIWWRTLMGNDAHLDNTHLMRFAGRFSRRIRAYAKQEGIPLVDCQQGERKHEIAEQYIPKNPSFRGVFCILAGRAPAPVFDVRQFHNGAIDIRKKNPRPYVNHYSFHIIDSDWGHVTIKLCPHPPFNAQIMLNGHEYVAIQARRKEIEFTKEGNCFTVISDATGLAQIADTMRAPCSVGRLVQVCERWIYSACLSFALDSADQQKCGFHYSYSVYQAEYSRNLLFTCGRVMDQVFQSVIDRTRAPLNIKTVKTIFGRRHRPFKKDRHGKGPRLEVVVEKPVYDLTVFKVHFGNLTVKLYSKGECVLRIEAIVHNARDLPCGRGIDRFPRIVEQLGAILERFLDALHCIDVSFIDMGTMESWSVPSMVGTCHVGGIDINQHRMRAMMEAVISLSPKPRGFAVSEVADKVREITGNTRYEPRHASYDLKKFRGKGLVTRLEYSRRYQPTSEGLRSMTAFIVLHDKVLCPLLAGAGKRKTGPKSPNRSQIDFHYDNIQIEMQNIFKCLNIAS
jgi:DNA-binding transcriptional ArsR family regulator